MIALRSRQAVSQALALKRNFASSSVAANKAVDPIQKLFLEKLGDYKSKSK